MKKEVEYLIDLKNLNTYESIAFQKAYNKVKKDVHVFEAELRNKIAQEIYQEEKQKIREQVIKETTVRLEKQWEEKYKEKMDEANLLIQQNKEEQKILAEQWEYVSSVRKNDKTGIAHYQIEEIKKARKYKIGHPWVTVRKLHKMFVPEIALSTFHKYLKIIEKDPNFMT